MGALHGDLPPMLRVTPFTLQPRIRMKDHKHPFCPEFDALAHGHIVTDRALTSDYEHQPAKYTPKPERFYSDDRDADQLYLEYIHDQACIQRDAVLKIAANYCAWGNDGFEDALYEYFYEQTKRKP
jgi:hypothetical protein